MRDNTFSKKVFIKTVSDNLKNKYRKTIDDATQQELYQAVSEAVKDVITLCVAIHSSMMTSFTASDTA